MPRKFHPILEESKAILHTFSCYFQYNTLMF